MRTFFLALLSASVAFAARRPQHFNVVVGAGGNLTYTPDTVHAFPGDTVTFQFVAKNHTSTTTNFNTPCPPPAGGTPGGWDSGFEPVAANQTTDFPTFTITVRDFAPRFVACRQDSHCQLGPMVFALNPNARQTLAQFKANAANTTTTPA